MTTAPILLRPHAYRDSFAMVWRLAVRHYELLWELQKRDLSDRYVGSVFGVIWGVVHPLILMALYVVVFGFVFKLKLGEDVGIKLDYPAYIMAGYLPWMAIMDMMTRSATVIHANVNLIKQVAFPTEFLPAKSLLGSLLPQAVGTVFLLVYTGVRFGHLPVTIGLLPVALLIQILAALGLGWLLALIGAYLRDTPNVLQVVFLVNLYLMPVVFVPAWTPEILSWVFVCNPFSHLVYMYQDMFFYGAIQHVSSWLICAGLAVFTFVFGFNLFMRAKQAFGNVL